MKNVDTPWYMLSKFFFFISILISAMGLVFLFLQIGVSPIIINAAFWLSLSIALRIVGSIKQKKLETLKNDGICYEGSIVKVIPYHWVKIGSYVTACIECSYITDDGERLIKSDVHLLSPLDRIEELFVKVYVDRGVDGNIAVEVFRG